MRKLGLNTFLIFFLGALSFVSCTKEDDNNIKEEVGEVTLTSRSISETSFEVRLKPDFDGLASIYLLDMIDDIPAAGDLLAGNISGIISTKSIIAKSGINSIVLFDENIQPGAIYTVLSVLSRNDGNISKTSKIDIETVDKTGSILLVNESTPSFSEGNVDINTRMKLVYDEYVTINKDIASVSLHEINSGKNYIISSDKLTVNDNIVEVDLSKITFGLGETVLVKIPEGAFIDNYGNYSKEVTWVKDTDGEYTTLDYFFTVRNEVPSNIMPSFLGACIVSTEVNGAPDEENFPAYEWDLKLKQGTESTVLLPGFFGLHNDLEFTFDVVGEGINFSRFDPGIVYDVRGSDDDPHFFVGEPDDSGAQYKLIYEPVILAGGYCGLYDVEHGQIQVSYKVIFAGYNQSFDITYNIQKKGEVSAKSIITKKTGIEFKFSPSLYRISK